MDLQPAHEAAPADALSQTLCRSCGLCCDGTLFETANLYADDDIDELRKSGITTICDDGKAFKLPCKSFDGICTIYRSRRAKVCGSYLCKLLRQHIRGVISFDRAAEIISQTKAQKQKAQAAFWAVFGPNEESFLCQYRDILGSPAESKLSERNLAKLNYVALRIQLERYFQPNKNQTKRTQSNMASSYIQCVTPT